MKMKILLFFGIGIAVWLLHPYFLPATKPQPPDPKRVLARTLTPEEQRQRDLTLLSVQASQASYKLPDLRVFRDVKDYVGDFRTFQALIPAGYVVFGADADIESGLKYVIFKPVTPDHPWVLAFTGTSGLIDVLSDVGLGSSQFEQLKGMIQIFSKLPGFSNAELLVTGHSLGGGLAQAAAHEIQRERDAQRNPARVILRTWNAFGAQELIQRVCTKCDPGLLARLDAANYFIQGDAVSRVGTHFGPTYEMIAPNASAHARDLHYLHSLDTIQAHVDRIIDMQSRVVKPKLPLRERLLAKITEVADVIARTCNFVIHGFRQLRIVQEEMAIFAKIQEADFQEPARAEALRYLYNVGMREQIRLSKSIDPDRRAYGVALAGQLQRIQPWLGSVKSGP